MRRLLREWEWFSTFNNVFKLQTFLFLVDVCWMVKCMLNSIRNVKFIKMGKLTMFIISPLLVFFSFWLTTVHGIRVDGKPEREQSGYLWTGHWRERKKFCSPVNVQSIKMNVLQRCDIYTPIPSICNQSIPIYLSIVIENRYQSITARISAID